jgi:hypothetical protein
MVTTRTPIGRPPRSLIGARAVELFKAMQEHPERYAELSGELHAELGLKAWQWPAVVDPDEGPSAYPADSGGGIWDASAKALWRELDRRAHAA